MKINSNNSTITNTMLSRLVVCALIGAQILLSVAYAASNKNLDFNQLIAKSDVIVFGECVAVTSEWRKNKIYTIATIRVDEIIKGDAVAEVRVEYLGGVAMHPVLNTPVSMNVSNGLTISVSEEAIFMLQKNTDKSYQVTGAAGGKLPVITDKATNEKQVHSGIKKIQPKISSKDGAAVIRGEKMSLHEFIDFTHSRIKLELKESK